LLPLRRTDRRLLRIEGANLRIGLLERIGIDARGPPNAANASTALRRGAASGAAGTSAARRVATATSRARPAAPRRALREHVLDALGVCAAVALELRLDPVDRFPISLGALATIAELGETFDRRLVLLELQAADHLLDRIVRGVGGGSALRRNRHGEDGR